jgi:hypothetical protein
MIEVRVKADLRCPPTHNITLPLSRCDNPIPLADAPRCRSLVFPYVVPSGCSGTDSLAPEEFGLFGTSLAVFGAIHPLDSHLEWGPWGDGHLVVTHDPACIELRSVECTPHDCMQMIPVKDVLDAVRVQLERMR